MKTSLETGELKSDSLYLMPALVAYTTVQWLFDSAHPSKGYGFPFEQPHLRFYFRLQAALCFLEDVSNVYLCGRAMDNRPFTQVRQFLQEVLSDKKPAATATAMKAKVKIFDQLHTALQIAEPNGDKGLNDDGDDVDIKTIKEKVGAFRAFLVEGKRRKKTYAKMIEQLDKYWDKLFADPITVTSSTGEQITIQPQRTNNILERFFRGEKRRSRKKSGTSSLNRTLKNVLADTPLVRNLDSEEYQRIVLNGCSTLAERFAQIDEEMVRAEMKRAQTNENRIPSTLKAVIRKPDLLSQISDIFFNVGKKDANRLLPT